MPHFSQPAALPLETDVANPLAPAQRARPRRASAMSPTAWGVVVLAMVAGMATSNPLLTPAAIAVLALLFRLLRRRGETPVLLFAMGMQWAQVTAKVFEADYFGVPVNELGHSVTIATAVWLGLAGVSVVAIGMHLAIRNLHTPANRLVDAGLKSLSVERLFSLHLLMLALAITAERLAWSLLPLAEILRALGDIRWAFYFLLGLTTIRMRRKGSYFLASTAIEFVLGIGYFSGFKTVLFMAMIAAIAAGRRLNFRSGMVVTVAASVTLFIALAWQSVKGKYRAYLDQGTHQQVVLVSTEDQVATFTHLVGGLETDQLTGSVRSLLDRLAYVDFFADVLARVPAELPHEGGALLWKAIVHVLKPRILFPDKAVLPSDSDETSYYTGRYLASGAQGTSFSLGYMVEQYIDFGPWLMFLPILVFGVVWGGMYRYCLTRAQPLAFRFAFASALLLFTYEFEMAEIKLVGSTLMHFIVFALFMRYALPRVVPWLTQRRVATPI